MVFTVHRIRSGQRRKRRVTAVNRFRDSWYTLNRSATKGPGDSESELPKPLRDRSSPPKRRQRLGAGITHTGIRQHGGASDAESRPPGRR